MLMLQAPLRLPRAHTVLPLGVDEVRNMKTYPLKDETGCPFAVEVDVMLFGLRNLTRAIATVDGVSEVTVRKPFSSSGDVRATFLYGGEEFAIIEPFGDSSRYWVGPIGKTAHRDISPIEVRLGAFQPSVLRRLIGGLMTLNFSALKGR